jgi:hypothetical protein
VFFLRLLTEVNFSTIWGFKVFIDRIITPTAVN